MKKTVRYYLTGILFGILFLVSSMVSAQAAVGDHYTVNVDGTLYYTKAFELLDYLNEERTAQGRGTLTMDQTLMDAAMQRAVECAVNFSHTRPNGSLCFTVTSGCSAENIAAGNSTASATFTQWMDSDGHRYNMLGSAHKSIGIGCYTRGSIHYWVQLFSDKEATTPITSGNDRKTKTPVEIVEKTNSKIQFNLNSYDQTSDFIVICGKSEKLQPGRLNPGWERHYCGLSADSFVWTSSDPSIASVDANGTVIGKRPGTAIISAAVRQGNAETATLMIKCKKDIADMQIADIPSRYENGSAYEPEIEIYDNGEKLEKDISYTTTYYSNTSAGTARVIIRGIGNYTGSIQKEFLILPRIYVSSLTIKDIPDFVYSGTAYTPEPEVYDGTTLLQEGTDYTVSYYDNVNASTMASVQIKGIGKYTGRTSKYFTIRPLAISDEITVKCTSFNYEAYGTPDEALENRLEVYYHGTKLTNRTDYYCYSSSYREADHQICTFVVNLRGNYSGRREYESLEYYYMKPIAAQTYTGNAIKPLIQLYPSEYAMNVGGEPLNSNAGYQVIYENNIQVGTAKVTVIGNGERYIVKVSGTFKIIQKTPPSEKPKTTPIPSKKPVATPTPNNSQNGNTQANASVFTVKVQAKTFYYTGKAQKPKLTVYVKGKKITSQYYTVSWKNNKYAGIATATVIGKGKYKGYTGKTSFIINLKKVELISVKASSSKKVKVKWKKGAGCQGYQIIYSTNSKFKNATSKIIKNAKTTNYALSGLKKGKKYYVKIRSYRKVNGGYLFSQWSNTKKVKVK